MKSKDLQPRLLYPASISFKIEGEIRVSQAKKKKANQTSITRNVKGPALRRRRRKKEFKKLLCGYLGIHTDRINYKEKQGND